MKIRLIAVLMFFFFWSGLSHADDSGVPNFFKETLPPAAMEGLLTGWGAMASEGASLDPKITQLISLAVAAQIPCDYCVYAHASHAIKLGATDAEIKHAVGVAGYVRLFSTSLNGLQYSLDEFKAEWDKILAAM